jgi:phosphatidylserine/phosphatidylglycerophosphate/cardiolipin synthase-like enzyme
MRTYTILAALFLLGCQTPQNTAPDAFVPIPAAGMKSPSPDAAPIPDTAGAWSLHFSPSGGCEDAIVAFIGTAKKSVHLMAYGFTEQPVADALIAKKGLDIKVVLDKSDQTAKGSMAGSLKAAGIPVWIDAKHRIMHDKIVIVDGVAFENGSYNFTASAEKNNAENCLIEQDADKAGLYEQNFQVHLGHSEAF